MVVNPATVSPLVSYLGDHADPSAEEWSTQFLIGKNTFNADIYSRWVNLHVGRIQKKSSVLMHTSLEKDRSNVDSMPCWQLKEKRWSSAPPPTLQLKAYSFADALRIRQHFANDSDWWLWGIRRKVLLATRHWFSPLYVATIDICKLGLQRALKASNRKENFENQLKPRWYQIFTTHHTSNNYLF